MEGKEKMKMLSVIFRNRNHVSQQKYPADAGMFLNRADICLMFG